MIQQLSSLVLNENIEHRCEGAAIFQLTPTATGTYTAVSDGLPGQLYVLKVVTSGVTSYTLTFGTGFLATGTLATGTTTAKVFTITFVSDGILLNELARTPAM